MQFRYWFLIIPMLLTFHSRLNADLITFEDLPVNAQNFFNGDTTAGSPLRDNYSIVGTSSNFGQQEFLQRWTSGGIGFNNNYTPAFDSWTGFSWSNVTDNTTAGFTNQYSAITGGGSNGAGGTAAGSKYAIAYASPFAKPTFMNLPSLTKLNSVDLTNTTYALLSMRDGDAFTAPFGFDDDGTPNNTDFFTATFTGRSQLNATGAVIGQVSIDLADYRFVNNAQDFLINNWQTLDLSSLTGSRSLEISFVSSKDGVPTYLALDNFSFSVVPEPSSLCLLTLITSLSVLRHRRRGN